MASNMITLKSPREIEIMGRAGRIVAGTLARIREILRPGLSTEDLDAEAKKVVSGCSSRECAMDGRRNTRST